MVLKKVNALFLPSIILLAAILRLVNLDSIPTGFNDDEAAFGYNAYSILKTGRDEWGRLLPFPVFESFGDWKLVGYLYLTVISQFFFGVNEFATRFPSALFGVLAVLGTYLFAKELFKNHPRKVQETIALVSALFLAISPWHIVASRNAFESDLLSFFITLATYFFLKCLQNKKYLTPSFIVFAASFYIYRSSWLFVPLFVLTLLYLHRDYFKKLKIDLIKNFLTTIIIVLPLIPIVLTFKGQSRFIQESFITGTSRIGITNEINERRGICEQNLPELLCLIAYNKYIFFPKSYTSNYFKNLSYEAYFENASPTGFQSFMKRSVFYLYDLPLIILGIILALRQKETATKILIPWILLSPVGAAIAGIGNYGRMNIILPSIQIIAAYGLIMTIKLIRYQIARIALIVPIIAMIAFSLVKLFVDTFYIEPFHSSRYQRYGYKELFHLLEVQKNNYDKVYISKKIDNSHQYIQYLYFEKVDPKFYQENSKKHREKDGWISFEGIENLIFVPSVPGIENIPPKSLLVVGEKEVSFPQEPIFTINYLNGDKGFEVFDIDQVKLNIEKTKLDQN